MKKIHKLLAEGLALCLAVFFLTGCNGNTFIFEKAKPLTYFPQYTWSLTAGDCELTLPFFFNEEEKENWGWWNIKSIYLRIGDRETM